MSPRENGPNVSALGNLKSKDGGNGLWNKIPAPSEAAPEERVRAILAKPFWDYEEAALILNIDVKTLRNMKWKREIPFTKFGRKVYFPRDLIVRELRKNTVLSPTLAAGREVAAEDAGAA